MRDSQYLRAYLSGPRYTIGTFLAYRLRGLAKRYSDRYARALENSLCRHQALGKVERCESVTGRASWRRVESASATLGN